LQSLLRARQGPLSRELLREPGRFGLGQVPVGKVPDATTTMVCGFCSTGCGLTVHLRNGHAVNLSPTTDYPVNRGMACPKGWEALSVLDAPDRATVPLLRGRDGLRLPGGRRNIEPVLHVDCSPSMNGILSLVHGHLIFAN
jgi:assimilatory nitrate reductase catalytic subunit